MCGKILLPAEGFSTLLTFVGFLSSMDSLMSDEVKFMAEFFSTLITLKGDHNVRGTVVKWFPILITFIIVLSYRAFLISK